MGDIEKVLDTNLTSSSELTASLMEQLGKAFVELEADKIVSADTIRWNDVEEHFHNLESRLKKKLEELEAKEKVFAEKESHNRMQLAEKEAAVISRELDMLDKVQELKDAAVAAIAEARANYKPESLEPVDDGVTCGNKVSSSIDDENATLDGKSPHKEGENAEGVAVEVDPRAELTQFCEQMDSKGLVKFLTENLKKLSNVCKEQLSFVLGGASDPPRFVLDTIEGVFPPKETTKEGDNGDAAILGERRSCLILMEALSAFLSKADSIAADNFLNPEIKGHALSIAHKWKPKLTGENNNAANGNSLEAEGFLRLLATFRIASEFDEEELCKCVLAVAHHRQATELCHSLELTQKIPGLVETLIKSGRQIDAVHFIHAFQLTEIYPTVPLLKTYLKELRRNSQGTGNAALQNDYNARELAALKSVIECVEDYKLENAYPLDPLHRRVSQLDKSSKGDKKRTTETPVKQPEPKKPRPSRGFSGPRPRGYGGGRRGPSPFRERVPYNSGLANRYSPAVSSTYSYPVASQSSYAPGLTSSEAPYNHYGQDGRPRDLYSAAAAAASPAPIYGAYAQLSRYPYM